MESEKAPLEIVRTVILLSAIELTNGLQPQNFPRTESNVFTVFDKCSLQFYKSVTSSHLLLYFTNSISS